MAKTLEAHIVVATRGNTVEHQFACVRVADACGGETIVICDSEARVASVCFGAAGIGIEMCLSRCALRELNLLIANGDGALLARVTGVGTVY